MPKGPFCQIRAIITVDTIGLTNGTIGTTNGTIGTNVSTNGNIITNDIIGYRETFRVLWLPMVPLASNGTIGKISNGTIGRIPNARTVTKVYDEEKSDNAVTSLAIAEKLIFYA